MMCSAPGSHPARGSLYTAVNVSAEHRRSNDLCAAVKIQIRKCHMAAIIIPVTFRTKNSSLDAEQFILFLVSDEWIE